MLAAAAVAFTLCSAVLVCGEDLSHESPDTPLPDAIKNGTEPFFIMGAIAGG